MERVYNGRTGEMVRSLIFLSPAFYQRLVYMAEGKVKFRNTGPIHPLTRQPVAERKRFGGIKFGEMERDCLITHDASANLHERLFTLSDSSQVHVCRKCKNVASVIQRSVGNGRKVRGPYCCLCETEGDIVKVAVPCGAKLLCQELFSMGICLKSKPSSVEPDREDECARMEAVVGKVIGWDGSRVFGVLAMSRSIADKYLKPWIIPDPDVMFVPRVKEDKCLILVSDGLWDVITRLQKEVKELILRRKLQQITTQSLLYI